MKWVGYCELQFMNINLLLGPKAHIMDQVDNKWLFGRNLTVVMSSGQREHKGCATNLYYNRGLQHTQAS